MYKRANVELLKQKIQNYDWTSLSNGSLDEACNLFTNTFLNFVKEIIPSKYIIVRPNDKPYYHSEIRRFSRVRDRLKKNLIVVKTRKTGINKHIQETMLIS